MFVSRNVDRRLDVKMVLFSVYILLVIFESPKVFSDAFNTYCTLPCPFMGPAQPPRTCGCGAIQLPPRRPSPMARSSFDDTYSDYDDTAEDVQQQPVPISRTRQPPATPDPPPPKPKRKPPPEDPEPPPKKKNSSSSTSAPSSPSIQPSRRFFTSLFSIPGAIVDTLVSGEIVL